LRKNPLRRKREKTNTRACGYPAGVAPGKVPLDFFKNTDRLGGLYFPIRSPFSIPADADPFTKRGNRSYDSARAAMARTGAA
jgi:hypothetical protein